MRAEHSVNLALFGGSKKKVGCVNTYRRKVLWFGANSDSGRLEVTPRASVTCVTLGELAHRPWQCSPCTTRLPARFQCLARRQGCASNVALTAVSPHQTELGVLLQSPPSWALRRAGGPQQGPSQPRKLHLTLAPSGIKAPSYQNTLPLE